MKKNLIIFIILFSAARLIAQEQLYNQIWNDPKVVDRINSDIEKFRKGDAVIEIVGKYGKPVENALIEVHQKSHEFLFGCNLFVLGQLETPELNHKYEAAFANLFNFATIPFYWRELEPQPGKPRFKEGSEYMWRRPPPDQLVKWCKAHNITPKGHALMYAKTKFMPDWTEQKNPDIFLKQARKHMTGIARRYKNDIAIWDVANEEMPRIRNLDQWHKVPQDYLSWCFQEAGHLFPKEVKLLYNDGTMQVHNDTGEYESLIKGLIQKGLRIEGMGIQFHTGVNIFSGNMMPPNKLFDVYEQLGKMNLPLYITEITIPGTGEKGPERQAVAVANLYRLWFSTQHMAGITWWNLGDGTAYMDENKALGGLIDKEMEPKPAYKALDRLINYEWKTNLKTKTDASGKVAFRGFHGKYLIQVTVNGEKKEFPFELKSGEQSNLKKLTF
jgi:endo-1,4-beta-xylanase